MKIKTSFATGAELDWLVAQCLGYECTVPSWTGSSFTVLINGSEVFFNPSTSWSQGGPIGDQMKISTSWLGNKWMSFVIDSFGVKQPEVGATRLIAEMRCYVNSKLGAEVDVPDSLACFSFPTLK